MDIFFNKFYTPRNNLKAWEATLFALLLGGSSIKKNHSFNWLAFEFIPIHFRSTVPLNI